MFDFIRKRFKRKPKASAVERVRTSRVNSPTISSVEPPPSMLAPLNPLMRFSSINQYDNTADPVLQWSDHNGIWVDGDEQEMASARCEGFQTRTPYRRAQPRITIADVMRAHESAARKPLMVGTSNWCAYIAEQLNTPQD
jgi:hypothetical protein